MRKIHLANDRGRKATPIILGKQKNYKIQYIDSNGAHTLNHRCVKSTVDTNYKGLIKRFGNDASLIQALISDDPEIDLNLVGKYVDKTYRVYLDEEQNLVYNYIKMEKVFLPDGSLKLEREPEYQYANVDIDSAIRWSGEYFPKTEIFNQFVFERSVQISHDDGLTFDFLFDIAKDLDEKKSLMLIGSKNGSGPLVFMDNGKECKGFLDGRIDGESYCLILHITKLELKALPNAE